MDNEKVYYQQTIPDQPLPTQQGEAVFAATQPTGGGQTYSAPVIDDQHMPIKRVAVELLSDSLNTNSKKILASFQFTPSGALQIGAYSNGVSGDIKISPNGIVARDISGNTTFALDGTTGNATFAGTIQAGSVIAGIVKVGNNNIIIDGANQQIIINDGTNDRVLIGYQKGGF